MEKIYFDREQEQMATMQKAKEGVLASADVEKLSEIFQVLSMPGRLKIVLALLNGEMCVYNLTEVCGGTVSSVSHQLRILRDNGIVKARRYGKYVVYSIIDEHIFEIIAMGIAHLNCKGWLKK